LDFEICLLHKWRKATTMPGSWDAANSRQIEKEWIRFYEKPLI
jgi:hypothetical protein